MAGDPGPLAGYLPRGVTHRSGAPGVLRGPAGGSGGGSASLPALPLTT